MASDRNVKFTEVDVKSLTEEKENANTKREISYDLELLKEFLTNLTKGEMFKKCQTPARVLIGFVLSIRFCSFCLCNKKKITPWLKTTNFDPVAKTISHVC